MQAGRRRAGRQTDSDRCCIVVLVHVVALHHRQHEPTVASLVPSPSPASARRSRSCSARGTADPAPAGQQEGPCQAAGRGSDAPSSREGAERGKLAPLPPNLEAGRHAQGACCDGDRRDAREREGRG
eukprot:425457-Hanusia_phi.AAC.4